MSATAKELQEQIERQIERLQKQLKEQLSAIDKVKIGYARAVPGQAAKVDTQVAELKNFGCDQIITDENSAGSKAHIASITELLGNKKKKLGKSEKRILGKLKKGNTLVVTSLSRLGLPIKQILERIEEFKDEGIAFVSIDESIDTSMPPPEGTFLPNFAAAVNVMTHELVAERTSISQKAARDQNRQPGRPKSIPPGKLEAARKLIASGMPVRAAATVTGVGPATLYRALDVAVIRGKADPEPPK